MRSSIAVIALAFAAMFQPVTAGQSENRSVAICKTIVAQTGKPALADLPEDQLKEQMCLSSLSVLRSADPMAGMECRLAYKALSGEFTRRHPGKEMVDVYGRC